jgi:translation initiation factor 2 subunit 3
MLSKMINQPIFNIGCLGSVSDGKSTLVYQLTGIKTQKHSNEKHRNITIKQGYGNMKIWENENQYYTTDGCVDNYKNIMDENCILANHISFVDCPGHLELIQTMLASISLMDGAIIIIAVDQPLAKKPQLIQHLAAAKLKGIDKIIVCMNKIDLVSKETLLLRKNELDIMLEEYNIKPFNIIPTCFNKKIGLDHLISSIMLLFNNNIKKIGPSYFRVSRSFDINKPGTDIMDIKGGVLGGSLMTGEFKVGDTIEIRPGQIVKNKSGDYDSIPITTKIISLQTDTKQLDAIGSGCLFGIGTDLDPYYCKNDGLSGSVVGHSNFMPDVYNEVKMNVTIVTMFGGKWIPKNGDSIYLQLGTKSCEARLLKFKDNYYHFKLMKPACIDSKEHIIITKSHLKTMTIVGEGYLWL